MTLSINRCMFSGNLTRDPEARMIGERCVAKATLAINRKWTDKNGQVQDEVAFVRFECWGKQAEALAKHAIKGSPVYIEGKIKQETWDKNGEKRTALILAVDSWQFAGPKREAPATGPNAPAEPPAGAPAATDTPRPAAYTGDDEPPF